MKSKKFRTREPAFFGKSGSVDVPVYFRERTVKGRTYPEYRVAFYDAAGERVFRRFSDEGEALKEAQSVAKSLARGLPAVVEINAGEAEQYRQVLTLLKPLNLPLSAAVHEFLSARNQLPKDATLLDAVRVFLRVQKTVNRRLVSEVVSELVEERTAAGCSAVHVRDLRFRLGAFARAFVCPLADVSAELVRGYLRNLKVDGSDRSVSNRTRLNHLRHIGALFAFGEQRSCIAPDLLNEIRSIEAPRVASQEAEIWTVKEMRALLANAKPYLVPALALAAFAGLRTAELDRLDWQDVRLEEGVVILSASKTKTASRRVVPILPNLAEWLALHRRASGRINPATSANNLSIQFKRTGERAGIVWQPNALRHSFCSYRLAVIHDPSRVAHEAGNSPAMIHRHYKALVTEKDGLQWFDIRPAQGVGAVILQMPLASAP